MEELDNGSCIFYYDILNNTVHHVLGHGGVKKQMKNYCTCNVTEVDLGRPMSTDLSDSKNPQLLFMRGRDEIWASDVEGCHCWRITKIPSVQGLSALLFFLVVCDSCCLLLQATFISKNGIYEALCLSN